MNKPDEPREKTTLDGLFAGQLSDLGDDGGTTGIFKDAVSRRIQVSQEGLTGDKQADRRHHGGPERVLCHYPAEHYPDWVARYPRVKSRLKPGSFGENLSTRGLTEDNVCVGDVFRLGTALIQVSQPRAPCWKLDRRMSLGDLAQSMIESGRSGWLYRVMEAGEIATGDSLQLLERPCREFSISRLWDVKNRLEQEPDVLEALGQLSALAPAWREGFARRAAGLKRREG